MTADEPDRPVGLTRQDVFSALGALGAIITLAAALMYYFGWRRSAVQAERMSIDVSLFGFTSQDYVLRSVSSMFLPLLVVIAAGLAGLWCHQLVRRRFQAGRLADEPTRTRLATAARITCWCAIAVAVACVLFTALAGETWAPWPVRPLARWLAPREWIVPLVLLTATLVAAAAAWLQAQLRTTEARSAGWAGVLAAALVAATVVLASFWLLEEYAASVGRDYAADLAAAVDRLPHAAVTSPTLLAVEAPGVTEELVSRPGDPPRYRTTGLRLLARASGKVLLVHDGWNLDDGVVVVLSDGDELAWQFSH